MRTGWNDVALGDICRLINGRAYKQDELLESGPTRVLRVGNFFTNRNWYYSDLTLEPEKYCNTGDLLYAWSASFGPRVWEGDRAIFHYHIWRIEPDPIRVDKRFLFHFLDWDKDRIMAEQGAGTTMIHVTKGSMEQRRLLLPPLPEQQRIVAILDEAFEGLALATANAEKNLKNARDILKCSRDSMFYQHRECYLLTTLAECCEISSRLVDPKIPQFSELIHVGAGNIETQTGVLSGLMTARQEGLQSGKFCFDPCMVLYSKIRPYLEKVARPEFVGICSADVYPLLPMDGVLSRDYLFHVLLSAHFTNYAIAGSDRAGMPKVNRDHLFQYTISLPPYGEQSKAAKKLDELRLKTYALEEVYRKKIAALTELKQSLLAKAFAGELTRRPSGVAKEFESTDKH
jgi:type I restriction enzyme S subunit